MTTPIPNPGVRRPGNDPPPPRGILELDHVYEALGHPRRRYLCYTLLEDTEWSLTDLATKLAAWENDRPEHEVTARQRERAYVSLYHAHVPKLVDEGVITFDDASETIAAAENAAQVLAALEGMGASVDSTQETHARSEMDDEGR
ncbi:hypothetical protein GWG54_08130 [Natronococcus sp. JC468]|uniref:DUF7344 domain-containing protein n=1 Tax=Natronococcus sp. JC468 TaxID=1961921 RepID=UPI00143A87D6|nr:hypothetical protein [Natronococcus sp. JC468]NKE35787.1 hypothetical protein [Natronococcus sp. JC468]